MACAQDILFSLTPRFVTQQYRRDETANEERKGE